MLSCTSNQVEPGQLFFKSDKKIIHAIAGCDTTSRLFGIGKSIPLKKMDNEHFRQQAAVFCETELSSNDAVTEAGEKAVVCLYGGKPCERLREQKNDNFVPKQTDDPVVPEYLLKVLRCFCTGNCETKKCSCKRYGLECTNACKHCNGLLCWNPQSRAYLKKMSLSYWKIYKTLK